ncbi:hypothetical protein GCM10007884_25600 [Methylobacterium brachythecii]|uniref:Uncharacterized protein n=1 Tax=Methylobacterium brachythecii TaxID=1176177 RepID=A0ABQ6D3B4_9HYPH|nr:hypothetical protein GCM10007884_25600 [Methylobacterium brachythecii]
MPARQESKSARAGLAARPAKQTRAVIVAREVIGASPAGSAVAALSDDEPEFVSSDRALAIPQI